MLMFRILTLILLYLYNFSPRSPRLGAQCIVLPRDNVEEGSHTARITSSNPVESIVSAFPQSENSNEGQEKQPAKVGRLNRKRANGDKGGKEWDEEDVLLLIQKSRESGANQVREGIKLANRGRSEDAAFFALPEMAFSPGEELHTRPPAIVEKMTSFRRADIMVRGEYVAIKAHEVSSEEAVLETWVSWTDSHLVVIWEEEAIKDPYTMSEWMYRSWRTGLQWLKVAVNDPKLIATSPKYPPILKYISILGVKNPETLAQISYVFEAFDLVLEGGSSATLKQSLHDALNSPNDMNESPLKLWYLLRGIEELSIIGDMLLSYPSGLQDYQHPGILTPSIIYATLAKGEDGSQTVDFLVELEGLRPRTGDLIEGEVEGWEGAEPMEGVEYDVDGSPDQPGRALGPSLKSDIQEIPIKRVDTPQGDSKLQFKFPAALPELENSFYGPSSIATFRHMEVVIPDENADRGATYQISTSPTEGHLVFEGFKGLEEELKEGQKGHTAEEKQNTMNRLYDNLADVLYSAWVEQKHKFTLWDIMFGYVAPESKSILENLFTLKPESQNNVITFEGVEPHFDFVFQTIVTTREGTALNILTKEYGRVLSDPEVNKIAVGRYSEGPRKGELFLVAGFRISDIISDVGSDTNQAEENSLQEARSPAEFYLAAFKIGIGIYARAKADISDEKPIPIPDRNGPLKMFDIERFGELDQGELIVKSPAQEQVAFMRAAYPKHFEFHPEPSGRSDYYGFRVKPKSGAKHREVLWGQFILSSWQSHLVIQALPTVDGGGIVGNPALISSAIYAVWHEAFGKDDRLLPHGPRYRSATSGQKGIRFVSILNPVWETRQLIAEIYRRRNIRLDEPIVLERPSTRSPRTHSSLMVKWGRLNSSPIKSNPVEYLMLLASPEIRAVSDALHKHRFLWGIPALRQPIRIVMRHVRQQGSGASGEMRPEIFLFISSFPADSMDVMTGKDGNPDLKEAVIIGEQHDILDILSKLAPKVPDKPEGDWELDTQDKDLPCPLHVCALLKEATLLQPIISDSSVVSASKQLSFDRKLNAEQYRSLRVASTTKDASYNFILSPVAQIIIQMDPIKSDKNLERNENFRRLAEAYFKGWKENSVSLSREATMGLSKYQARITAVLYLRNIVFWSILPETVELIKKLWRYFYKVPDVPGTLKWKLAGVGRIGSGEKPKLVAPARAVWSALRAAPELIVASKMLEMYGDYMGGFRVSLMGVYIELSEAEGGRATMVAFLGRRPLTEKMPVPKTVKDLAPGGEGEGESVEESEVSEEE
ncbi:hypothetical protein ABW19_dt0202705 [Dactylella cylindrospora]|nr:hypothetical protein ABW19_dt0202705 [Dactylella cylindrospora]